MIIPDFERDALSLSGVAIGRAVGPPVGDREALADVLPFAPTVVRALTKGDRIGALLRGQSTRRPAQSVLMESEIVDAAGAVVHAASRTLAAGAVRMTRVSSTASSCRSRRSRLETTCFVSSPRPERPARRGR